MQEGDPIDGSGFNSYLFQLLLFREEMCQWYWKYKDGHQELFTVIIHQIIISDRL